MYAEVSEASVWLTSSPLLFTSTLSLQGNINLHIKFVRVVPFLYPSNLHPILDSPFSLYPWIFEAASDVIPVF